MMWAAGQGGRRARMRDRPKMHRKTLRIPLLCFLFFLCLPLFVCLLVADAVKHYTRNCRARVNYY